VSLYQAVKQHAEARAAESKQMSGKPLVKALKAKLADKVHK